MSFSEIVITATDRASAALKGIGASLESVNSKVMGLTGTLGGLAVVGFAAAVKKSLDATDALGDAAAAAGFTAEAFQELRFAANQSGISTEQFNSSMSKFSQSMGEARDQTGPTAEAFRALGVNVVNVNGTMRDGEAVFNQAFTALTKIESQAERAAISTKLFGREAGVKMAAMAGEGAGALDSMRMKAREMGLVMDNETVASVGNLNDKLEALSNQVSMKFNKAVADNVDTINTLANAFIYLGDKALQGFKKLTEAGEGIGKMTANVFHPEPVKKYANEIDELTFKISKLRKVLEKSETSAFQKDRIDLAKVRTELDGYVKRLGEAMEARDALLGNGKEQPKPAQKAKSNKDDPAALAASEAEKKKLESLKRELDGVIMYSLSEEAQINESYTRRAVIVQNALNSRIINEQRAGEIITGMNNERIQKIAKLEDDSLIAKQQERAAKSYEQISQQFLTEDERLRQHLTDQEFIIEEAFQYGVIREQERNSQLQQIRLEHEAAMGSITSQGLLDRQRFEKMSLTQQSQFVLGTLVNLTAGVAQHNKTMFNINKVAGIANAIMNTAQAATKALSSYPPPLSFAMAAATVAAGIAQVNAIKNTSFGGSSAPSVAGSTPATPVTNVPGDSLIGGSTQQSPARTGPQVVNISLPSEGLVSAREVRALIERIDAEIGEMGGTRFQVA